MWNFSLMKLNIQLGVYSINFIKQSQHPAQTEKFQGMFFTIINFIKDRVLTC